jgi:hypothetical protein
VLVDAGYDTAEMFVRSPDEPWPTLQDMVDSGQRLVIFVNAGTDAEHPWFLNMWYNTWDTSYAEREKADMNCDRGCGDQSQAVYVLNNWLSTSFGLPDESRASEVNDPVFIKGRAAECWRQHGSRPTFVFVDWWRSGDVVAAVQAINEASSPDDLE